jgi:hypothetical protein
VLFLGFCSLLAVAAFILAIFFRCQDQAALAHKHHQARVYRKACMAEPVSAHAYPWRFRVGAGAEHGANGDAPNRFDMLGPGVFGWWRFFFSRCHTFEQRFQYRGGGRPALGQVGGCELNSRRIAIMIRGRDGICNLIRLGWLEA